MLAQDFARFVALAETGQKGPIEQIVAPYNLEGLSPEQLDAIARPATPTLCR
jgi:hypothetical protein